MNLRAASIVRDDCHAVAGSRASQLGDLRGGTVVVTGGTGFVGTWLAELLAYLNDEHGFETRINLLARHPERLRETAPHLVGREDVRTIAADVRDVLELPTGTTWLIHAAGKPDLPFHATYPLETMSVASGGTMAVLNAVLRYCSAFRRLLYLSSAFVYGPQPAALPALTEDFTGAPDCRTVSAAYPEAKRHGETLCAAARSQMRIPTLVARPFTFVGPYQTIESPWALTQPMRDALDGRPVRVPGAGQMVGSFLYGSDMAFWLLRILAAGEAGEAYNVGSPHEAPIEQASHLVAACFAPMPSVQLPAARTGKPVMQRLVPDTRAAAALGLHVTVPLKEAISRTVAWFRASR